MDFWATVGVALRRWYVVLPALLLAFVGVGVVYTTTPTTYEATAVVLLHTPTTGSVHYANGFVPNEVNPLLNSGNDLNIAGTILIQAMSTTEFAQRIGVPTDGRTTLTVNNGTENPELLVQGPFIFVMTNSPDPAIALSLVQRALAGARDELSSRQTTIGAPAPTFVDLTEIVAPTAAVPQHGNKLRSAGAVLVLGLLLSLASAFATESVMKHRRSRRSEPDAPPRDGQPPLPATDHLPVPPVGHQDLVGARYAGLQAGHDE